MVVTHRGRPGIANRRMAEAPPDGPLSDTEISAFLHQKIDAALNNEDGELSETRERLFSRYIGGPVGEESEAESSFRTREVFEMIEDSLPSLMSIFFSSQYPVVFKPRGPEDVDAAKRETAIINHYLFHAENSFLEFYNFFKAALLDPVAYVKVHCRHVERTIHHKYAELTAVQLDSLMGPKRVWKEGVEIDEVQEPGAPEPRFSFEGTEIRMDPEFKVEAVPPEQVLVDRDALYLDLDKVWRDYGFIAQESEMTFTELVKMGFEQDELDQAGGETAEVRFNDERTNRNYREDESPDRSSVVDYSTRKFTVYECYVMADFEGDGIADTWKVMMVGDLIRKEKVSYQPFVAMGGIPVPFKHAGLSPAEAVEDLQLLKTKLTRIALNDEYRNEVRRSYVDKHWMTGDTIDQMKDPNSALVVGKGSPHQAVMPEPQYSILEESLAFLQYADDMVKRRTGIAPDVALNPDVLRDATAHGMLASLDRSSGRLMHVARLFAETGVKRIGVKMHQLLRMYQDSATFVEIRGDWVPVDPAQWQERTDMRVVAGLGFNTKEQSLQARMQILGLQREALPQGLCTPVHIKNNLEQMIEAANLGFYEQYFVDPEAPGWKPPPPPPDPQLEAIKMQGEVSKLQEQTKQMTAQREAETKELELGLEAEKIEIDRTRVEAQAELDLIRARMDGILLARKKRAEVEKLRAEVARLHAERDKLMAETATLVASPAETRERNEGGSE